MSRTDRFGGTASVDRMTVWYDLPNDRNGKLRLFSTERWDDEGEFMVYEDHFEDALNALVEHSERWEIKEISGPHPNGTYMVVIDGCKTVGEAERLVANAAERAWGCIEAMEKEAALMRPAARPDARTASTNRRSRRFSR
jgi:hypothetical protein